MSLCRWIRLPSPWADRPRFVQVPGGTIEVGDVWREYEAAYREAQAAAASLIWQSVRMREGRPDWTVWEQTRPGSHVWRRETGWDAEKGRPIYEYEDFEWSRDGVLP